MLKPPVVPSPYHHNLHPFWLFLQLARNPNVAEVAKSQGTKSHSVANHLKALERRYGKLYDLDADGLRLTERGLHILKVSERVFAELDQLQDEPVPLADAPLRGLVALAAPALVAAYELPPLVAQFQELHSGTELRLSAMPSLVCQRAVQEEAQDLAIVSDLSTYGPVFNIDRELWGNLFFQLYSHPESIMQDPALDWPTKAARVSLLLEERGSWEREAAESGLSKRFFSFGKVHELSGAEAIRESVIAGLGVGYLPECAVRREVKAGLLRPVEVPRGRTSRPLFLIRKKAIHYSPLHAALWSFLQGKLPTG